MDSRLSDWAAAVAALMLVSPQTDAASNCVDVEVNGVRTPSIECMNQQLNAVPQKEAAAPLLKSEQVTQAPSNQLGLFNRAATSISMGNTFGKSAFPQRPK